MADIEYELMTDAPKEEVIKLLRKREYEKDKNGSLTYTGLTDKWINKYFMSVDIENVNEDNFDMYQAERSGRKEFLTNPKTRVVSCIEEYFSGFIDQEYLIEEGKLEKEISRTEVENHMKKDFEYLKDNLTKNFKTDCFSWEEGMDLN